MYIWYEDINYSGSYVILLTVLVSSHMQLTIQSCYHAYDEKEENKKRTLMTYLTAWQGIAPSHPQVNCFPTHFASATIHSVGYCKSWSTKFYQEAKCSQIERSVADALLTQSCLSGTQYTPVYIGELYPQLYCTSTSLADSTFHSTISCTDTDNVGTGWGTM